jgi:hypothetical protein
MKPVSVLLMVCLVLLLASTALAQEEKPAAQPEQNMALGNQAGKVGVGFQFSFPAWGLSGKYNVTDKFAVQGVFGFFGSLKTYAARGLYKFKVKPQLGVYGYGMVGAFSYKGFELNYNSSNFLDERTETVVGFGAGAGVEYFFKGLEEIGWNLEIGFGSINFDQVDYNFSMIMIGAGAHYFF